MNKLVNILLMILFLIGCVRDTPAQPSSVELGHLVLEDIPQIPERIWERLNRYEHIRSANFKGWLPGGEGILILTRFGETNQVHRVEEPGGCRQQLTFFEEPVDDLWISPSRQANGFLFTRDIGGSEMFQIYFYDLDSGRSSLVTDGTSRNGEVRWSNRGDRFVYYSTRRNGRDWDLYLADIDHPENARRILEAEGTWWPLDWSPDDSRILVINYVSVNEVYPYLLDVSTGELEPFHRTAEKTAYSILKFSSDGRGIYFVSDQNSEFRRLQYFDLGSREVTVLTGDISWDIEEFTLSDDGRYLAFTANEDGIDRLHLQDFQTGEELSIPELPFGCLHGLRFDPQGAQLGLVLNTPQTPGDVYSLDLVNMELSRWTFSELGGLRNEDFVLPNVIRFATFDSIAGQPRTIPAFYYRPRGEGPFAVVVDIHGGPEVQARPSFHTRRQFWVSELGLAVLQPNVRGSKGYGKSYLLLDNGHRREDSVRDIGALLDWIAKQPELDAGRVAVYGSSYGGYMSLAAMIRYQDRLRAAIDLYGISNFVTFLENTGDYRRDLRRAEYGDERDPDMRQFLQWIAPVNNAESITKPLFIFQGLNDPRVPVTESEQMVETIREHGGEVWYLLAKDEGHGVGKRSNRDFLYAAMALFLERYLLTDGQ